MEDFSKNNERKGITYSVTLQNENRLYPLSFEQVLELENVKKTKIKTLSVDTGFFDASALNIQFENLFLKTISYQIKLEEEEKLLYLEENINEFCQSLKPMYSPIVEHFLVLYFFVIIPSFIIILKLFLWIFNYFNFNFTLFGTNNSPIFFAVIYGSFTFLAYSLILKIFPVGQFKIGNGIKKFEELKLIRNGVLGFFVLSLLASLFEKIILN